jgi:hypothetical protein
MIRSHVCAVRINDLGFYFTPMNGFGLGHLDNPVCQPRGDVVVFLKGFRMRDWAAVKLRTDCVAGLAVGFVTALR